MHEAIFVDKDEHIVQKKTISLDTLIENNQVYTKAIGLNKSIDKGIPHIINSIGVHSIPLGKFHIKIIKPCYIYNYLHNSLMELNIDAIIEL